MLAANGAAAVEESSDEGEDWDHPLMEVKRGPPAEASRAEASLAQPSLSALMGNSLPGVSKARGSSNRFNEAWVRSLHEEIQAEIESDGMKACTWERLLEKWSTHIRDAPYEKVSHLPPRGCRLCVLLLLDTTTSAPLHF